MNGYILHETRRRVVVATGFERPSENPKTGPMIQVWILCRDTHPVEAVQNGQDADICGACVHRGDGQGNDRTCYVSVAFGPAAVWRAYRAGKYPRLDTLERFAGQAVRLGAYGDPAYIPRRLVAGILARASAWTGYTHQWRAPRYAWARRYLMASCETLADVARAHAHGWRTFRTTTRDGIPALGEVLCPNVSHGVQCIDCRLCSGASARAKSITIPVHGAASAQAERVLRVLQ